MTSGHKMLKNIKKETFFYHVAKKSYFCTVFEELNINL